jgi:uncharacterized protein YhbP (UPF0306 family)
MSQAVPTFLDIARRIFQENRHLTLATHGDTVWATPLYYCTDDRLHIYFTSKYASRHGRHLAQDPRVAFAIYDSRKYRNGIQGTGTVEVLKGTAILRALRWYKTDFQALTLKTLSGAAQYRLYRLTPDHIYIQDPVAMTDSRVEVPLPAVSSD